MDDQNNNSGQAAKQVPSVNMDDELSKDALAQSAGDSDGEYSALGSSPANDLGDLDPSDPDAGGVMDIDAARASVGERNDGDGEFRNEVTDEDLNLNASDDLSTPRPNEPEELDKAA